MLQDKSKITTTSGEILLVLKFCEDEKEYLHNIETLDEI